MILANRRDVVEQRPDRSSIGNAWRLSCLVLWIPEVQALHTRYWKQRKPRVRNRSSIKARPVAKKCFDRCPVGGPAVEEVADPYQSEAAVADQSDAAVLARAEDILASAIALGREGRFTIVPEHISISATDNCNLRCIMCPGHAGMTGPRLSVEQANSLFGAFGTDHTDFGSTKWLDMTAGEPLLNTQLHIIFRNFKTSVPTEKIQIISNATLPIKGRVKEAIDLCDSIGLSIDGATKETYERIRKGSTFENVTRNIRDVAELKQKGKACDHLTLMFVVMDQNAPELPELIRLAADLGIPNVFAQAVEVRTTPFMEEGDNMNFDMPAEELRGYIEEAQAEADRLGVHFRPTNGLLSKARAESPAGTNTNPSTDTTPFGTGA